MRLLPLCAATLFLLLGETAVAQRRSTSDLVLLPEVQAEIALPGNDYVLVGFNAIGGNYSGGPEFSSGQLRFGYEHFWSENWSGGGTLRVVTERNGGYGDGDFQGLAGNVIPGVLVRHAAPLGLLRFSQRLGVEYAARTGNSLGSDSRAHARLRLGLDREFAVGSRVKLRPRLSYEALTYLRFQRDENQNKERFIDFGNARAEVGVRLSPRIDFTPWFALQTQYINALMQFDQNNNPVSGGRTNLRAPVLGLDLRFLLGKNALSANRIVLPTQH